MFSFTESYGDEEPTDVGSLLLVVEVRGRTPYTASQGPQAYDESVGRSKTTPKAARIDKPMSSILGMRRAYTCNDMWSRPEKRATWEGASGALRYLGTSDCVGMERESYSAKFAFAICKHPRKWCSWAVWSCLSQNDKRSIPSSHRCAFSRVFGGITVLANNTGGYNYRVLICRTYEPLSYVAYCVSRQCSAW